MTLNGIEMIQLNDLPSPLLFEIFTLGALLNSNSNNRKRSHQNSLLTLRLVCQDWDLIIQSELKELSFRSCVCPSATIALHVVSKFPHLQYLSLKGFRDLTPQHFTSAFGVAASSSSSSPPCSASFSSSFSSPPIRSLRLKNVHLTNDILIAMVDQWGNTLQHFSLTGDITDDLTRSFLHLLHKCGSSLRSLHFTPQSFSLSTIEEFVKTCNKGLLTEITWPSKFSFQPHPTWYLVPSVLKTNPNLRLICIHDDSSEGFNNTVEDISIVFEWLAKYCPELEVCTLNFVGAGRSWNKEEGKRVERFARNCKKLKSLTVEGWVGLQTYRPFAFHGQQLETLRTGETPHRCEVETFIDLCVLNGCTQLKTLRIYEDSDLYLFFIDTTPFPNLQTTEKPMPEQWERIEEFVLRQQPYIFGLYDMMNQPDFAGFPNLKTLAIAYENDLGWNLPPTPSLPVDFFQRCPSLKNLYLRGIEFELFPVFENCSQLTDVTLFLDQTSLQVLTSLAKNCPQLRRIDVFSALDKEEDFILIYRDGQLTTQHTPSYYYSPDMTKGFVSLIQSCSQLEVIGFPTDSVSTAGLMEMATSPSLNRLKTIALGGSNFTNQVLEALINRRPLFPFKKICLFNNELREDLLNKTLATFPHLRLLSNHARPSPQLPPYMRYHGRLWAA